MNDERRGQERMKGTPHCCPICCTFSPANKRDVGRHAPMWLTEKGEWYCPRSHTDDDD